MVSIAKRQDCSQPFPDDDQIFRICSDEKAPLRFYSLVSGIIVSAQAMNYISNFVSLHPYFKVHPGKLDAFKAGLPAFVEKTKTERKNLFYDFTISDDDVLCREGYIDADGLLVHLANVDALLKEALKIADLTRLEVHCPAKELDKLKGPLAKLKPLQFVRERGIEERSH